jgi:hypothetical protein
MKAVLRVGQKDTLTAVKKVEMMVESRVGQKVALMAVKMADMMAASRVG